MCPEHPEKMVFQCNVAPSCRTLGPTHLKFDNHRCAQHSPTIGLVGSRSSRGLGGKGQRNTHFQFGFKGQQKTSEHSLPGGVVGEDGDAWVAQAAAGGVPGPEREAPPGRTRVVRGDESGQPEAVPGVTLHRHFRYAGSRLAELRWRGIEEEEEVGEMCVGEEEEEAEEVVGEVCVGEEEDGFAIPLSYHTEYG